VSRAQHDNSNGGGGRKWLGAASSGQPQLSKSLQLAISIPPLFSSRSPELGIAEVADLIGLSRPNTHRYITTFVRLGYLEQYKTRKYGLAVRVTDSGLSLIGAMRRASPAVTVLEELRDGTGYTVSMGALNGGKVTYIHRLLAHRPGQYHINQEIGVGAHVPIHCTALGKALLAGLTEQARRKLITRLDFVPWGPRAFVAHEQLIHHLEDADYREPVVSDEEFMYAARSIAMFVPRPRTEPLIAIDVTVPAVHLTSQELVEQIGPGLVYAAKRISEVAGD
jgi:DNA-binding IclR family transcriptional regulator